MMYYCTNCLHEFEIEDNKLMICPRCGGTNFTDDKYIKEVSLDDEFIVIGSVISDYEEEIDSEDLCIAALKEIPVFREEQVKEETMNYLRMLHVDTKEDEAFLDSLPTNLLLIHYWFYRNSVLYVFIFNSLDKSVIKEVLVGNSFYLLHPDVRIMDEKEFFDICSEYKRNIDLLNKMSKRRILLEMLVRGYGTDEAVIMSNYELEWDSYSRLVETGIHHGISVDYALSYFYNQGYVGDALYTVLMEYFALKIKYQMYFRDEYLKREPFMDDMPMMRKKVCEFETEHSMRDFSIMAIYKEPLSINLTRLESEHYQISEMSYKDYEGIREDRILAPADRRVIMCKPYKIVEKGTGKIIAGIYQTNHSLEINGKSCPEIIRLVNDYLKLMDEEY